MAQARSHPPQPDIYQANNKIRIVTAASLFDGHDAAINIMRRILQATGAEIIHLGHDRSVADVVGCAVAEDANAIAMTSYQGGHVEYLKYMVDMLEELGCGHIKVFAGGGGVILPDEIKELEAYGVERIYAPDDGRAMGLQGMINDLLERSDSPCGKDADETDLEAARKRNPRALGRLISAAENYGDTHKQLLQTIRTEASQANVPILGITGTGGAGKSSLVDELIRRFLQDFDDKTLAVISVDPSRRKTGGALLGDRIRMNSVSSERVYMHSLATRQANMALSHYIHDALNVVKIAGFDMIILETSGIGQSDTGVVDHSDVTMYVMTPEYGAATQLEKIDMLDFADIVVLNKFDKRGALDALRDVKKQYKRNHLLFHAKDGSLPIYGTIASQFNDPGTHKLYRALMDRMAEENNGLASNFDVEQGESEKIYIIPPERTRYLSEISKTARDYDAWARTQADIADKLQALEHAQDVLGDDNHSLDDAIRTAEGELEPANRDLLETWSKKHAAYKADEYVYKVRGKEIRVPTHTESLSGTQISKVALPNYRSAGDLLEWQLRENVPGSFPFTAGVFSFKRVDEDPTRQFAGEGNPERTNRRFHYLSVGHPATRLSTAFDSVTLYGRDPAVRPDIYGKVGNSGVSICCLDDAKKLYSGFNLVDSKTSVSMTINGPAPTITAFYMNAAIDQQCEIHIRENGLEEKTQKKIAAHFADIGIEQPTYAGELPEGNDGLGLMLLGMTGDQVLDADTYAKIKADTMSRVRGTVQADILKEDQAQNTCIFSTEFSLKLMGDVQEYFSHHGVRNFYSVSISGYHMAEAGCNPITQLAFTLANGFTFVEYYISRGLKVDEFAPNLSFFFSNAIDPEYAVIGRVARRIWAKAMREMYGASRRSQKLKYHVQTSGRSLHAQEIGFNDIRTTLEALYAIYDNCNSLHTNAYDEAITTPTEESVRRAVAIQLIINHELGLAKNENPTQGSFVIEELTDLVEEAVLTEFDRLTERGGVLGAMESMYQRGKIQEESLYYEQMKHTGELPIIGVNTFLSSQGSPTVLPKEVTRSSEEEKQAQIATVKRVQAQGGEQARAALTDLIEAAQHNENVFEHLLDATKVCTLGQITETLFNVGGQYRRSM